MSSSPFALTLYAAGAVMVLTFMAAAIVSFIATRQRKARLERIAGDVAFIAFVASAVFVLGAVTGRSAVLYAALAIGVMIMTVGFATRPRCSRCGEGLNLLTNRQFRAPHCLFCGSPAN
jgi:uncharacterized membrane protein